MTHSLRLSFVAIVALAVLGTAVFVNSFQASAQAEPDLDYKVYAPMLASDGLPVADETLPPADPSYCAPTAGTQPPDARIAGALTINGAPAPAGTVVQMTFDGVAGPAARSRQAGAYSVDFYLGTGACSNQVGDAISLLVNGQTVATGKVAMQGLIVHNVTIP